VEAMTCRKCGSGRMREYAGGRVKVFGLREEACTREEAGS